MKTMMALRAHERGGPEKLIYEEAPLPEVGRGEVLVEVHGAAITFAEFSWDATWTTESGEDRTPVVPSHEVSGVVTKVAADVEGLSVGDEVYGLIDFHRDGAAAEFTSVPAEALVIRPVSVSHVEAAAVPLAALTAWQALTDVAHLQKGERVFVQGGAGGVGSFAVQLAKVIGGHVTASAFPQDQQMVSELGADVVVNYPDEPIEDLGQGFDVLIDTFGGPVEESSYGLVRSGGRLVTLAGPPSLSKAQAHGISASFFVVHSDREQLERLAELVDEGRLRPLVSQAVPLAKGREAFASPPASRQPGKTVLVVRP